MVIPTEYPIKNAHDFIVLGLLVLIVSYLVDFCDIFTHIIHGCLSGTRGNSNIAPVTLNYPEWNISNRSILDRNETQQGTYSFLGNTITLYLIRCYWAPPPPPPPPPPWFLQYILLNMATNLFYFISSSSSSSSSLLSSLSLSQSLLSSSFIVVIVNSSINSIYQYH